MPESLLINRRDLDFQLFEVLQAEALAQRPRHADHSRETFTAALDTAHTIAEEKFAPHNRASDEHEPTFENGRVRMIPEVREALDAFCAAGLLAPTKDYEQGGMQLPVVVAQACSALFKSANGATTSYVGLTLGNANVIERFGSEAQKAKYLAALLSGRFFGTMALTEPQAGSSLSDLTTSATPQPDGTYRIKGSKIFISGGDHELRENIVHLVLARIPGAPPGVKGISLFSVPKFRVNADGSLGPRNDVKLSGLIHKAGWRGTTSTMLSFGDEDACEGELVGQPHQGLACMFHMMNEARIGIGMAATMLGLAGYYASLDYAKNRPQGRPVGQGGKDAAQPQVRIIEHADVKRMLLAQKSYGEGALALNLFCARLVDEQHTGAPEAADEARLLLEVLTPIAKSWPSEFCLEANSLAIQIHGGYGYTRDFPVEQYWRDNRLNMIHEGTHGIQAADLLGRKVLMENGRGMQLLSARMQATMAQAVAVPELAAYAAQLGDALQQVGAATQAAWATGNPAEALANAVPYMQAFGHTVLAWVWLDVALATLRADATLSIAASAGRMGAARYFYHYELPKIGAWLNVVNSRDTTCAALSEAAF